MRTDNCFAFFLKRLLSFVIVLAFLLGLFPAIRLGENGSLEVKPGENILESSAFAASDPLTDITALNGGSGVLSDYVEMSAGYQITGYTEITATSSSTEGSDFISAPKDYPSYYANGGSSNNHFFTVISDPSWTATSGTIKSTVSNTMRGDAFQCGQGNTRASSKTNSKVLQIHALKTVSLSFDYSESIGITSTDNATNKAEKAFLYYLITDSAQPTLAQLKGSSAVCMANGSSKSVSGTDYTLTVEEGMYLYLYFFAYIDTGDCSSSQSGGGTTFNYTYSATVSNVQVTPQESKYSLTVGCTDSGDNLIGGGKLANGTATYSIPSAGFMTALDQVAGGTRVNLTLSSAPSGYMHIGWRNKTLGTDIYSYSYSFSLDSDMEVYALFAPAITVTMGSNGYADASYTYKTPSGSTVTRADQFVARNSDATVFYKTLAEAFSAEEVVVLIGSVTLNGDFTIPEGKTLSLPYDRLTDPATNSLQTGSAVTAVSIYTKATINGTLTLNGNLVASGRQSNAQSANGKAFGPVANIVVGASGEIHVGSTGKLYAYGVITGPGFIDVASNGTVYELMEVRDLRAFMALVDASYRHQKAMAFSQFFVKTNEAETRYNTGAKLIAKYYININNVQSSGEAPVIGPYSSEKSMFMLSSGSMTKSFHSEAPYNNKILLAINDGSEVRTGSFAFSVTVSGYTLSIDTSQYEMPICYGYGLIVEDGGTITFDHSFKFLPGSMLDIQEGGTLNISSGKKLVLYRANDYDFRSYGSGTARGFSAPGYPVSFTKISGLSYASNTAANVGSVAINVDGVVNAAGGLYVTDQLTDLTTYANGYNRLTGTGEIRLTGAVASGSIYEEMQNGTGPQDSSCTTVTVDYVPIKGITNYDAETDDGQTDYSSFTQATWYGLINDNNINVWSTSQPVTLTYDANGGTGSMDAVTKPAGTEISIANNEFTAPAGSEFLAWNTHADGSGETYAPEAVFTLNEDTTLYAQWTVSEQLLDIYVIDDNNGDHMYCHLWKQGGAPLAPWPGVEMEYQGQDKDGHPYYRLTVNAAASDMLVVNNGTNQTADLNYVSDAGNKNYVIYRMLTNWSNIELPNDVYPDDAAHKSVAAPTCTEDGVISWTGLLTENVITTAGEPATGHAWGEPVWSWTGTTAATATFTCGNDNTHVETVTATISSSTTAATCEADGATTYTATASFNGTTYTDTKTETIPATGHAWGEPVWSWTGTTAATATFTCANDNGHTRTLDAEITSEQGTGADAGHTVYTASVTLDGKTYTDVQKVINQYTIVFVDDDDTVLSTRSYDYGTPAASIETPADPTKAPTAQYTYTFAGWTPEIADVTGDATYKASYTAVTNKYKVSFVDWDGTVLKAAVEYDYGTPAASIETPADPVKASTAQYSYSFAGWTPALAEVTADATYTATYTETLRSYTVTWYNEDGSVLLETDENVEYGTAPRFDGTEPAKAATAEFSYTFYGWKNLDTNQEFAKNELPAVQGDVRYAALFTEETNQYTIRFFDGETLLLECTLDYGATPAYSGDLPVKEKDAQYSYVFVGWKLRGSAGDTVLDPLPAVTGDAAYETVYSRTVNEYTITWIIDGVSETSTVPYGEMPSHAAPSKASTAQYSYVFTGWDPELTAVTGDATYTAVFESILRSYTIRFVDEDGTALWSQDYDYGQTPAYGGETPVKEADAQYTYEFAGWTPAITEVTGPATYTATYTSVTNTYTVIWNDYDGSTLETDTDVPYGTMPSYDGAEPSRAADAQYSYRFAGWTPEVTSVTGNATYTATYSTTVNKYTVTFVDEDGTVLKPATAYDYGTPAASIEKPEDPVKEGNAQYSYRFAGWTPVIADVTEDVTYRATYTETLNTYTVTWLPEGGGEPLETDYAVPYGTTPVFDGTVPEKASTAEFDYSFTGWTDGVNEYAADALPMVTGDVSYTAVYTGVKRLYTVTWLNGDGTTLLEIKDIPYGDDLPAFSGSAPTKQPTEEFEYTFKEWTTEDTANIGTRTYEENEQTVTVQTVKGNITFTPVFDSQMRSYTVEFRNADGTVIQTGTQLYGSAIVYEGSTPVKAQDDRYTYTFSGWTLNGGTDVLSTLPAVSGNMIFTAAFEAVERTFTVTWKNHDGSTLETDTNVAYGATPSYDSDMPAREQDAQYTYSFAGWEPELAPVTKDVTYTAKFTAVLRSYTVIFDADGGTVDPERMEVLYGGTIIELPVPTREGGWVFIGWYTTPMGSCLMAGQGTPVTAETVFTGNATIYAHWRLPGDINGDGEVDNKDVARLMRYIKYGGVEVVEANLDVNGDGEVDNKDIARLKRAVKYHDVEIH